MEKELFNQGLFLSSWSRHDGITERVPVTGGLRGKRVRGSRDPTDSAEVRERLKRCVRGYRDE
jgi:hypothetical protein